jgi:O-antigen ligase
MLNIIIPLLWIVLSSRPFTNGKAIAYLYKALNISICAAFLLCLTGVLLKLNDEIPKYWWNAFVHKSFTQALSQHPSYLSLYAVIAVNGNLDKLYNNIIEGRFSLLTVVFLVVSFAFVVLISAKMAYIILGLFFFIFLGRLLVAKKIKWALVFSAAFLTMTSVIYIALPSIYNRVTTDYSTFVKSDFKLDNTSPASERIYIWKTSFDIISESQLGEFCVKTKEQIWSRIEKKDKENLEEKNAHNNFLEFGLKYGVLGIILLLLFVCWCFNFFRKTRNFLFLGIVLTFLFFSLTESTLVREMGVIYMAFIFQIHIINISKRCIYE